MPPSAPGDLSSWIAVGRVTGLFGAHGEVRVRAFGRFPQRFRELRRIYLGERFEPAVVLQRRIYRAGSHDGVVMRLDILRDRDVARERIGQTVYVPESEAVALPEGEYFVHQIIGLTVRSTADEELGRVTDVLQTGSNDVYVVRRRGREVLIPATKEVIRDVDLAQGTMLVQLLPGLIDEEASPAAVAPPETGEPAAAAPPETGEPPAAGTPPATDGG